MCGIAGIFRYNDRAGRSADPVVAKRMVDSLVHRGPDGGAVLLAGKLALGHRRLSILDLSNRGRQPMSDDSGELWIAFNGEIYNFREIRRQLEHAGYAFHTETDTEVILYAYREWGMDCIGRFNGMFAFALWDAQRGRLWLARDPVGIKPLFYRDDGTTLHFGSEIKAILADPAVARRPDWLALDEFLTFAYPCAPRTGFEGIRQLLPGHSLIVEEATVRQHRYFQWPYPSQKTAWDEGRSVAELRAAVHTSVGRQMVSDVPVGAFLSGGVDSSAVVWAMRQHTQVPPRAFCIGFEEDSFDESPVAREVARRLGVDLHVERMVPRLEQLLLHAVSHAEEPLADNSMLAMFLLCQATRPHVKVALSGDGADELLAGYATYRASRYAQWYRLIPRVIRTGVIAPLVRRWPSNGCKYAAGDLA
jgi:asparagine synthase (glutamine-hydrolysing)